MIFRSVALIASGTIVLAVSEPLRGQRAAELPIALYARGEFAAVAGITAERKSAFDALRREVKGVPGVSPKIKAAFLLEAIDVLQHRTMARVDPPQIIDGAFRGLFHDACDFVAELPPGDAFRPQWYLAAVAALAGGRPGRGVAAASEQADRPGILIRDAPRFAGHVDPGRMALAGTLAVEALAWSQVYQKEATIQIAGSTSPEFAEPVEGRMPDNRFLAMTVSRAVAALKRAETTQTARAEALLRRGALVAAAGNPQAALLVLDESASLAEDEWVAYLAYLLRGRALEGLKRAEQAESAFRMALAVRPRARSANLALAANLFARGVRADAAVGFVLDPAAHDPDPWAQFENGDYRFWPARRADLRKAIQ
jgi:hypothetical protein